MATELNLILPAVDLHALHPLHPAAAESGGEVEVHVTSRHKIVKMPSLPIDYSS